MAPVAPPLGPGAHPAGRLEPDHRPAKADRLDAAVLAHFGEARRPAPAAPAPNDVRHLTCPAPQRHPLIGMWAMETARLARRAQDTLR